jgi:hypothetical protein
MTEVLLCIAGWLLAGVVVAGIGWWLDDSEWELGMALGLVVVWPITLCGLLSMIGEKLQQVSLPKSSDVRKQLQEPRKNPDHDESASYPIPYEVR